MGGLRDVIDAVGLFRGFAKWLKEARYWLMGIYRSPEEITVCKAVQYIAYESKWGQKRKPQQGVEIEASEALERAAEDEKIVIKGRLLADDWKVGPICRDYWVTASIITYGCMERTGGRTAKKRRYGIDDLALLKVPVYFELHVARQDVEKLWPRPFWIQRDPQAYHLERMRKEAKGVELED